MRSKLVGVMVGIIGVIASWLGQAIWKTSPDDLWAAIAVVSVLAGCVIFLEATISRLAASLTRTNRTHQSFSHQHTDSTEVYPNGIEKVTR